MTYKVVKTIKRKAYPTNAPKYSEAHSEASNKEKKRYPKGYAESKKIDAKLPSNQLAGTHTKKGKITLSKKVPRKLRPEIAFHEREELKAEKRLERRKK